MSLPDLNFGFWLLLADWSVRIGALLWIPSRTSSAAARSWLLLVFFVPLLGLPLYLLFGHPWLSRERVARQRLASQVIRDEQAPLAHLRWTPKGDGADTEIVPLVERLGDFMATHGNRVELLDDYDGSLQRLIDDIDGAARRVHLLYYLMFDDAVGDRVTEALLRAARRGVECRLLLDAVGAKRGLRRYAGRLRDGGVDVQALLPGGLRWRRSGRMDLRNHRKVAVIDNTAGYIGSQNLADAMFVPGSPNRELVARVEGPVVAHLEAVFASDWFIETGERLEVVATLPACDHEAATQVLPSGPAYPFENARDTVNALIHLARRELVLVTPYFVPDEATLAALRIAALSGVQVTLIVSASNNQPLTALAQHSYYDELLAAGVRIALYRPHFLHAKHMRIDDGIALVGSINLDIRSFALNAEVGLLCYDRDTLARMRTIEDSYLADAEFPTLDAWRRRPAWRRSLEGLARLADSFM
ncbi:cardiolipin synthase [Luteimonas aestuarii]|uniref:Cardiolipin synthase n=1 Tax=Luteimonas aestuarii TaxID=453837 RepID=A0A4R5TPE9_9GAMM|nr:cardiolipin synthase [Luteimonas aestuarii]TDK22973.1 cardiolipin synthase [Luteimonas aestuarii]